MKELLVSHLTGHGVVLPLAAFIVAGVLVFVIASHLAEHADAIADSTKLGHLWVGSLLLAASTSLPEIITDVNAAIFALPNIGVGDLLGSTLANMLILAMLLIVYERRQLLQHVALDHALVGGLGILLTGIAGMSIAAGGWGAVGSVGIDTLVIAVVYVVLMRVVFDLTQHTAAAAREEAPAEDKSDPRALLRKGLIGFGAATAGLLATVPLLVFSAEAVAIESGLSNSFVGTVFVGFTTSFPEMAAAIAAVRLGAVDLAVGNIFGSNAFNMTVLLVMDIFYRGSPLLKAVDHAHVISAFAASIAIALGLMAILARTHKEAWVTRVLASMIIVVYGVNVFLLVR